MRRSVEYAFAHPLASLRVRARALPGAVRRGLPPAHRPLRQRVQPRPRRRRDGRGRRTARARRRHTRVINERSLAAVDASRLPGGRVRPLYDSYGFARIPGTLLQLFGEPGAEGLPGGRPARARRCSAARRRRARRRARLDVRRALRRARAPARAAARRRRRLEADDAVPLDDDRARDDAAHRAAGRRARRLRVVRLRALARPPRVPAHRRVRRRGAPAGWWRPAPTCAPIYPQADGLAVAPEQARRRLQPRAAGRDRRHARSRSSCAPAPTAHGFESARAGAALAAGSRRPRRRR